MAVRVSIELAWACQGRDFCEPLSRLMQSAAGPASYQVEHIHAAHSGSEVNDLNPDCIFLQAQGPRSQTKALGVIITATYASPSRHTAWPL
jgi:hypothetical protein